MVYVFEIQRQFLQYIVTCIFDSFFSSKSLINYEVRRGPRSSLSLYRTIEFGWMERRRDGVMMMARGAATMTR